MNYKFFFKTEIENWRIKSDTFQIHLNTLKIKFYRIILFYFKFTQIHLLPA